MSDADTLHNRARAALSQGDLKTAGAALQMAIAAAPRRADIRNTAGDLLLAMERPREALGAYEDALTLDAGHVRARINLGRTLTDLARPSEALTVLAPFEAAAIPDGHAARAMALLTAGRAEEALTAAEAALAIRPDHGPGLFAKGRALTALLRFDEAREALSAAAGQSPGEPGLLNALGEACLGAGDLDGAGDAFEKALGRAPTLAPALEGLAQIRWMQGRAEQVDAPFEAARAARPDNPDPWYRQALTLRRMERRRDALALLREAENRFGHRPAFDFLAADLLREEGALEEALVRAERAHGESKGDWAAATSLVKVLLQRGEADRALSLCKAALGADPLDQFWLAYAATAGRALGHPPAERLADYAALTAITDIPPPPGHADTAAFNRALADRLDRLHKAVRRPLDQTLRGGTQTTQPLNRLGDPLLDAFFEALRPAVDAFIAAMPDDPDHPFFGRKADRWRLSGAWSVRLQPEGFHVSHFHGEGWISSAYYVDLPPDMAADANGSEPRPGWLTFGEPPIPVPGAQGPERAVQPRIGRLALFPSCLWHGTVPFAGQKPRLTIAMDIVPCSN
ncbi:MAG: tetratricopeptide repeat protein [Alphaproteobacteria bacterium]